MILRGYCDKQKKEYAVSISEIPQTTLEDAQPTFQYGILRCDYAGFTGCCNSQKECSIVQNAKK